MKVRDGRDAPQVLALEGDLDIFAVARVWESIHRAPDRPCASIDVDLSRAEDIDPSGLQLLLALRRSCQERSLPVAFKAVPVAWGERLRTLGAGSALEGGVP